MNNLKEFAGYNQKLVRAVGHPCIMLTDPITGKIVQKVEGENHVFSDALFMTSPYSPYAWSKMVSQLHTVLSDDNSAVDTTLPYMLGNVVGYGVPSTGGSGTYRGAYNLINQVLAKSSFSGKNLSSIRWKFQYDFTTAQANGTIKSIGLTYQYNGGNGIPFSGFILNNTPSSSYRCLTNDGRYIYSCSTSGIITKYDIYLGTFITVDVSATVGTVSSTYKNVGYAPSTGKYYIYTYSNTANLRFMYIFSDNTFSTLESTYSVSNITFGSSNYPMYIYGNYAFYVQSSSIYYADFVNNVAYSTILTSAAPNDPITSTSIGSIYYSTTASGKYLLCGSGLYTGLILDMSTFTFISRFRISSSSDSSPAYLYPTNNGVILFGNAYASNTFSPAVSRYVLDTPITKTAANGMTVTYELEVFM